MNPLKFIMHGFIRGYARQSRRVKSSTIQPAFKGSIENQIYPDLNEDNFDPFEDYDDFNDSESDFSSAGKSYTEHMREQKHAKEMLKKRIVVRKYFKSNDPNFLTWTEREQIQSLHNKDSVEWTPERLSESFPALPETIKKILKSKWLPQSIETVNKYDQQVIDNWKLFKTESLPVSSELATHLKKFKDRKIDVANLTMMAEKFVKKPPVFPTPKSNIFSNIVKGYIENTAENKIKNRPQITDEKNNINTLIKNTSKQGKRSNKNHITFDAFLEKRVDEVAGNTNLSLENQLLVDEYKQQKSMAAFDNNDTAVSQCKVKEPSSAVATVKTPTMMKIPKIDINTSSMDTGVLEWKKKTSSGNEDYPNFIKVPRAKAKSGVTFRVQDRYYDTDGEFLYRVPGLKT